MISRASVNYQAISTNTKRNCLLNKYFLVGFYILLKIIHLCHNYLLRNKDEFGVTKNEQSH